MAPSFLQSDRGRRLLAGGAVLALVAVGVGEVLSMPAGQSVLRVPFDKGQGNLGFLDFLGTDRLVIATPDRKVEVRDVPSGKPVRSFASADRLDPRGAAVSPDGTRLAHF